jgi:hypothetical protein
LLTLDGQISHLAVQPRLQKYFVSPSTQINSRTPAIPFPQEGRIAIVTDAGRDAVDADAPITNGTDADGEVVWSWRPDAGVKPVELSPPATVANKPGHRGEHEGNR